MANRSLTVRHEWRDGSSTFYVSCPIDNQTLWLGMELVSDKGMKTNWWNIAIAVYNKRKQARSNELNKKLTGRSPVAELNLGRKAVRAIEEHILSTPKGKETNIFYCTWIDNRRRDVYYHALHKMGYDWGRNFLNEKCIMKKVEAKHD